MPIFILVNTFGCQPNLGEASLKTITKRWAKEATSLFVSFTEKSKVQTIFPEDIRTFTQLEDDCERLSSTKTDCGQKKLENHKGQKIRHEISKIT